MCRHRTFLTQTRYPWPSFSIQSKPTCRGIPDGIPARREIKKAHKIQELS